MCTSELSLWQVTGSQAKLAKTTKEFIDLFTWEDPEESESKEVPWDPRPLEARGPVHCLTASVSVSASTVASFSLPETGFLLVAGSVALAALAQR